MRKHKTLFSGLAAVGLALGLLIVAVAIPAQAKSILDPGDIAIIGYNFDDPDAFAFVALVELDAGTMVTFTDNGWMTDSFRLNEGVSTWIAPTTIPTGTIVVTV